MENSNTIKSGFQFTGFFVQESYIKINSESKKNLNINIQPEGKYFKNENKFFLFLIVNIDDEKGEFQSRVVSRGEFRINGDIENIRDYFNTNAPAIMFPYIRAYLSTLTNLSTAGHPITLPTLKMNLKEALTKNTTIIE
jgi:preprotein translocase subunit SecB